VTDPNACSDEDWAAEVVETNGTDLLAYLARRTASPADAADVLGNVLLVIWRKRRNIPRAVEAARMWSFGVARNALRENRRHGLRQMQLVDALRANLSAAPDAAADDPIAAAEGAERASHVRAAVAKLTSKDRELVTLVHWDGFSLAEAAAHLRMNPSTVRTRYARARSRLAAELQHLDGSVTLSRQEPEARTHTPQTIVFGRPVN
jgi:RNA polymerase sigma-70 factor (ECF subfamily)